MIDSLEIIDVKLFYFINSCHNTFFDIVFKILSEHWCIGVVIVLIFGLVTLRKAPKTWWLVILCVGLSFLFADRISVMCFKDVFCRLRPCHALEGVRILDGCGGKYGFVSSHAANVFSLTIFFSFVYRKIKPLPYILFAWAILIGYSRPYLGVHYPGDVVCGAILGCLLGYLVYAIYKQIYQKAFKQKWE